jgi:hypothetical protein
LEGFVNPTFRKVAETNGREDSTLDTKALADL